MGRIRVVWASEDMDYVERLLYYVRSSDEQLNWHFHTFTDVQLCQQFLSSRSNLDLLVIDTRWEQTITTKSLPVILLTDTSGQSADNVLFKFQPLPKLLATLKSLYITVKSVEVESSVQETSPTRATTVLAVFSAAGGTGKTMTALQILKLARQHQLRTFYLNLEIIPTSQSLESIRSEDDVFARLLYYLQSNADSDAHFERLREELKQSIMHHEALHFDYIPAFHHLMNRLEFGSKEVNTLLELILKPSDYDLVVLDLDTVAHTSTTAALKLSDRIVWLVTDDIQCLEKTNVAFRELSSQQDSVEKMQEKSIFVLNKYTGNITNESFQYPIFVELPYIPQWKSVSSMLSLEDEPFYLQKLQKLIDECIGKGTHEATFRGEK